MVPGLQAERRPAAVNALHGDHPLAVRRRDPDLDQGILDGPQDVVEEPQPDRLAELELVDRSTGLVEHRDPA